MNKNALSYQKMIFVCTNTRAPGERISCAGQGRCGEDILFKLKTYVKEKNLQEKVRVTKSGCHEKCEKGPNLVILPDNQMVSGVSINDMDEIIETYLATQ